MKHKLKGVVIGAGYFSQFHYDAWSRIEEVEIVALSDLDNKRSEEIASKFNIRRLYSDYREMLLKEKPDFVDVITPPNTHDEICRFAADLGIAIISQKPLTTDFQSSQQLVSDISKKEIPFVVHENFRFQPWHREIKKLLDNDEIGKLHNLNFRSRMGDGWGEDAYLSRQPYFRDYKRLLIYETGVHYIDTFRYHGGEIESVYTKLRRLNPVIKGEDFALMLVNFETGTTGLWDANRYNENNFQTSRYTFGEYLVEGSKGTIRLYSDGKISLQKLGEKEIEHNYIHHNQGFAGDCCYNFQKDFVFQFINGNDFETSAKNYLNTLRVQEAVYKSAIEKKEILTN